jgi:hypothetical protein
MPFVLHIGFKYYGIVLTKDILANLTLIDKFDELK